jgi:formimidoylglutamate deiminase
LEAASFLPADAPKHIHVAEQVKEVEEARAVLGKPPIEALLEAVPVDDTWTLVHATQGTDEELADVSRRKAVVALCPTTEANLGDGFFPFAHFRASGGRFAIGSDSNVCLDPAEELRLLEYTARLTGRRRLVAATDGAPHTATALWTDAARDGAAACGSGAGSIAVGQLADLVVLDDALPQFAGRRTEDLLDTFVFGGVPGAVRDVMVAGRWVVRDRRHPLEGEAAAGYAAALRTLYG